MAWYFGWLVMIAALYIIDMAKPEEENMFTNNRKRQCADNMGSGTNSLSFLLINFRALHKCHWDCYQFQKASS
jgi:hypothetical protein